MPSKKVVKIIISIQRYIKNKNKTSIVKYKNKLNNHCNKLSTH